MRNQLRSPETGPLSDPHARASRRRRLRAAKGMRLAAVKADCVSTLRSAPSSKNTPPGPRWRRADGASQPPRRRALREGRRSGKFFQKIRKIALNAPTATGFPARAKAKGRCSSLTLISFLPSNDHPCPSPKGEGHALCSAQRRPAQLAGAPGPSEGEGSLLSARCHL